MHWRLCLQRCQKLLHGARTAEISSISFASSLSRKPHFQFRGQGHTHVECHNIAHYVTGPLLICPLQKAQYQNSERVLVSKIISKGKAGQIREPDGVAQRNMA